MTTPKISLDKVLVAAGMNVWWDKRIRAGQDLDYAILQAIDASCAVVVCVSSELLDRGRSGMYPEIYRAAKIQSKLPPDSIFLIPVRLSPCKIPQIDVGGGRTMDELKYVDLFPESNWDKGVKKLVVGLKDAGCGHQ